MVGKKAYRLGAAAVLAVLAVAGNYLRFSEPIGATALGIASVHLEADAPGQALPFVNEQIDADFLGVLKAKEVVFRTYTAGAQIPVWMFIGYFDRQKEGSQVHSPIHCYPGSGWSIVSERAVSAQWGGEKIRGLVVSDGFERRLVYYWYQTPGKVIGDVIGLKLQLTKNAILRRAQEVVFVRLSTPLENDYEDAENRLKGYSEVVKEQIDDLYRRRHETG